VLAGEESGDLHGAAVIREIKKLLPSARFIGLGGPRLAEEGVELLAGLDRLAVMGFVEPIRHLPFFLNLFGRIRGLLQSGEIDLVVAIDYPGFNLKVVKVAHGMGVPVLYYIVPQFWAWKRGRVNTLAQQAKRIAVILPFECEPLERAGGDAVFVGHPLLERLTENSEDRARYLENLDLDQECHLLAVFPGSRNQELERHLPVFLEAAHRLATSFPKLRVVVARARSVARERFSGLNVTIVDNPSELLRHSQVAIVKSGTSTLEAAVAGVPCVCVYRTHPLTYFWAKRVVQVPHIALPNLIVGRELVPELVQGDVTPQAIVDRLTPLIDDHSAERSAMIRGFAEVRGRLGRPGAARRVAEMAIDILDSLRPPAPPEKRSR